MLRWCLYRSMKTIVLFLRELNDPTRVVCANTAPSERTKTPLVCIRPVTCDCVVHTRPIMDKSLFNSSLADRTDNVDVPSMGHLKTQSWIWRVFYLLYSDLFYPLHTNDKAGAFTFFCPLFWGGGVVQFSERRTRDPKTRGSNPVRSTRKKKWEFVRVKNVVLTRCRCAQPPCVCIRAHTKWSRTHAKDLVPKSTECY